MINLDPVSVIKNIAPKAAALLINQAQRNKAVIKILKELKLDPTQPPNDVDGVYAYTLVEYGVYKPEPLLQLFREKALKNAFWQAYTTNTPFGFLEEVENFLKSNALGDDIQELRINLRVEIEEFGEVFIQVARRTKSSEFEPYPEWNLDVYPAEFKALIQDKTRVFCGRVFVFQAFERFIREHKKGYFTVIGEAGMGKTAIAAKYVYACKCPCYFNSRSDGRNRPEFFLESIRKQSIKRYNLHNAARDNLATLLEKVSQELSPTERVVILVDALDEVNQEKGTNLLNLPDTLPDGVYFFLTRRPYRPEKKRLYLSPDTPTKELDLSLYVDLSREDVKQYIQYFLYQDPEHQKSLRKWINDRQITPETFVEQMADKSQNNFMYLRYILPDIARGFYNNLDLKQLPEGLQDYYQVHWERMGMNDKPQENKVIVLFILVAIPTPITCEIIAGIAEQDEYEVQQVLDEWVEYVKRQGIESEICYNIYHASFLDFLTEKPILGEKRKLFEEVRVNVANFLY